MRGRELRPFAAQLLPEPQWRTPREAPACWQIAFGRLHLSRLSTEGSSRSRLIRACRTRRKAVSTRLRIQLRLNSKPSPQPSLSCSR